MVESFVKNVFCGQVRPIRGSVLRMDLICGVIKHSAIYVGDDRIVEVCEENGRAKVRCIRPNDFLNAGLLRTGAYIYVATNGGSPLGADDIAQRALRGAWGENPDKGNYTLLDNNCHRFTRYCILGRDDATPAWEDDDLEDALKERFGVSEISWASTGFGANDATFGNGGRITQETAWALEDHQFTKSEIKRFVEIGWEKVVLPDWEECERINAVERLVDAVYGFADQLNLDDIDQMKLWVKCNQFSIGMSGKMREELVTELGG